MPLSRTAELSVTRTRRQSGSAATRYGVGTALPKATSAADKPYLHGMSDA